MISGIVKKGMTYLNSIEDYENRLSLLKTLLDTSEGKVVS